MHVSLCSCPHTTQTQQRRETQPCLPTTSGTFRCAFWQVAAELLTVEVQFSIAAELHGPCRLCAGRQLRHAPFLTPSDASLADKRAYHRLLLNQHPPAVHAKAT